MAKQTVTLRLDEDDLTYLSQVEISGAGNLSEKIRALLAEARAQREGCEDFAAAHDFSRRLFARIERELHAAEMTAEMRSESVHRTLSWLPEITAFVLSAKHDHERNGSRKQLERFELGLAERVFSLVESMLQLSHAGFSGCYSPEKLVKRAGFGVKSKAEGD
ncbi:MAG: hypothetical protein ACNA7J_07645 [Wenzhouxiangella sp.]